MEYTSSILLAASTILPVVLVLFWLWMFWDMTNNQDLPNDPTLRLRWPPVTKLEWTLAFIVLNIVVAGIYFVAVYKPRH